MRTLTEPELSFLRGAVLAQLKELARRSTFGGSVTKQLVYVAKIEAAPHNCPLCGKTFNRIEAQVAFELNEGERLERIDLEEHLRNVPDDNEAACPHCGQRLFYVVPFMQQPHFKPMLPQPTK